MQTPKWQTDIASDLSNANTIAASIANAAAIYSNGLIGKVENKLEGRQIRVSRRRKIQVSDCFPPCLRTAKSTPLSTLDFSVKNSPNFKGDLQEYLQSKGEDVPEYSITDWGTPQKPLFKAEISVFGQVFTQAQAFRIRASTSCPQQALYAFLSTALR